jgi:hypothetical protein
MKLNENSRNERVFPLQWGGEAFFTWNEIADWG